jgi:hypothetical protein
VQRSNALVLREGSSVLREGPSYGAPEAGAGSTTGLLASMVDEVETHFDVKVGLYSPYTILTHTPYFDVKVGLYSPYTILTHTPYFDMA